MRHIYFLDYYKINMLGGDLVDKNEFKNLINNIDLYNSNEYNKIIADLKHNVCQNMRIARKLSNIEPEKAAQYLGLEPQSLRRIEAENDRDEFSSKVLILAIMIYGQDANFYFKNWKENELLLQK